MNDKKGRPTPGKLALRVKEETLSTLGRAAVEEAKHADQTLPPSKTISLVTDKVNSATDAASNQSDLVASFNSLLTKVDILVKIGDQIAKVDFSYATLLAEVLNNQPDSSLCQLCVAGTLRWVQGETFQAIV